MFLDTIKLGFGHNLILGFMPPGLDLDKIAAKIEQEKKTAVTSCGLFDSSTPNYTTYYPDVKAEDLIPQDSEFIEPTFRALSEVIVHKAWNPVDFSMNGVLRKSTNLLVGATVNPDHDSSMVGSALGAVSSSAWQKEYTSEEGYDIPAGIIATLKIDGKSNPRIARGIMMDPPSIHSTSVTVNFTWEKSHPQMADDEFWGKLGTFDKDGAMYRRIANSVKKYPEISLVHHGADPFAQKTGRDGKIVNPRYANTTYNSEQIKELKESKIFFFDFKTDLIENSDNPTIPTSSNNNDNSKNSNGNTMNELLALAAFLGLTVPDGGKVELQAIFTAINKKENPTQAAEIARLTAEVTRLTAIETAYTAAKADLDNVTSLTAFKTNTLTAARAKTLALYTKVADNKPEESITNMINGADLSVLAGLDKQYTDQLEEKFPMSCGSCGSTTINRASSAASKEGEGTKVLSNEQAAENLRRKKAGLNSVTNSMHGEVKK